MPTDQNCICLAAKLDKNKKKKVLRPRRVLVTCREYFEDKNVVFESPAPAVPVPREQLSAPCGGQPALHQRNAPGPGHRPALTSTILTSVNKDALVPCALSWAAPDTQNARLPCSLAGLPTLRVPYRLGGFLPSAAQVFCDLFLHLRTTNWLKSLQAGQKPSSLLSKPRS